MAAAANQILEEIKKGIYHPIYFLQGDEPYFIDLISNYIEKHALTDAEKGFNQMVMYGKDSTVSTVLTNAKRFPMMAQRQVVLVKEAQEINDLGRQEGQKLLQDYIEQPLSSTILVFCYKYKTLDGRKALSKSIAKHAVLVDCKKLYDNQIPAWVSSYVAGKGFTIDHQTAQLLSDYIGNNLERMSSEIEKVLINLVAPAAIDSDAVQKYVGISKEYNVFELQKALSHKDSLKAQRIVQYFGANPKMNPIIPVIAVLFSFYAKLLMIHQSKSNSESTLAQELKIRPFFLKEYLLAKSNYSRDKVIDNIHYLRLADLKVKGVGSNQFNPGEILKELIFKLMH